MPVTRLSLLPFRGLVVSSSISSSSVLLSLMMAVTMVLGSTSAPEMDSTSSLMYLATAL